MQRPQHMPWLVTALQASLQPKNQKAPALSRKTSMMKPLISMRKNSPKWQELKSIDFYFITDSGLSKKGILNDVQEAINAGCKIVQYREKNKNKNQMHEALQLRKICDKNSAVFLINDDVKLALATGADGVHLDSYFYFSPCIEQ